MYSIKKCTAYQLFLFNINNINMKTIIRIERPDGIGMFMNDCGVYEIPELEDCADRHGWGQFPKPQRDINVENKFLHLNITKDNKEWFCAYKSIEQLQQWIKPNEFKHLFNNAYKVLLLDVTEYQEGEYQILYTKESILNSKDISNLF